MPNEQPKILAAMHAILQAMDVLAKDKKTDPNAQMRPYSYRSIDELLNKLHPALVAHKVIVRPEIVGEPKMEFNEKRSNCFRTAILQKFVFTSLDDGSEFVVGPILGEGCDAGDKAAGKAHTAAYKTGMYQTFCVPVSDGSVDPESGQQDGPEPTPSSRAPKSTPPPAGSQPPATRPTAAAKRTPPPTAAPGGTNPPAAQISSNVGQPGASVPGQPPATPPVANPPHGDPGHVKNAAERDELHHKLVALAGGSEPIACEMLKNYTLFPATDRQTGQPIDKFVDNFTGEYLRGPWLYKTLMKVRTDYDTYVAKGGTPI